MTERTPVLARFPATPPKALFVNEFRSMLSDKLLNASDYDTDREVRNLELLKKRFGETALASCEVMLRDISESKRATRAIQRHFDDDETKVLDATIVSRLCWPMLPSDKFELPPHIATEMARFEKQFMHHKAPRKLVWKPTLGCVTIDVAFADKTIKGVKCSPLHATILHAFNEQPTWTLSGAPSAGAPHGYPMGHPIPLTPCVTPWATPL